MTEELEREILRTRAALADLSRRAEEAGGQASDEALEALGAALEELEVTSEELQQQNEELRATQAELDAERRAYQDLFDLAPAPYLATTTESGIREANQAASDLLGVPVRRLEGRVLAMFVPEDARAPFRQRLLTVGAGERAQAWEFPVQPRTGPQVLVAADVIASPGAGGDITQLRWVLRDVTEARRAQQALQEAFVETTEDYEQLRDVDRWKNAFLAAAAHDLRSPLAVITTGAETLLEYPDVEPGQVRLLADRIAHHAHRLRRLLDDLLDLDRFTRGTVTAERRPTEVRALVEGVVEGFAADDHPIDVTGGPVSVELDAPRVEQIVQNLVANAIAHTPGGTAIHVDVSGEPAHVTITVADEGPGIPPDVRDELLLPFVSAASHDEDQGGTGIGLSLVDLFAKLHGGRVRVQDRPGGGTRFVVDLPGPAVE